MNKKLKVSVLMSVYNGEMYLKEAIESILKQTYKNFEFLIIDDASTDSSLKIIKSFKDKRIKVFRNKNNLGLTKSLNIGIKLAKYKYIARMDADDISLKDRLKKQVLYLEEHPDCLLVATKVRVIDSSGNPGLPWEADFTFSESKSIKAYLPIDNCIAHPSVMFRKDDFGLYNEDYKNSQDYAKWLELVLKGYILEKLDEELLLYRIHKNSITKSNGMKGKEVPIGVRFIFLMNNPRCLFSTFGLSILMNLIKDKIDNFLILSKAVFIKWIMHILARTGYSVGAALKLKFPTKYLFIFPDMYLGGAGLVHIKILKVVKKKNPIILITNQNEKGLLMEKFRESSCKIYDLSKLLRLGPIYCILQGFIASMADNQKNSVIFGSNNSFFYRVIENIRKNTRKIDLIHAVGGGINDWGLPFVDKLSSRVVITHTVFDMILNQYKEQGIPDKYANKVFLIENYTSVPEKYSKKSHNKTLKVLFVGRGNKEKRPEIALEVARKCYEENIPANFNFVGDFKKYFSSSETKISNVAMKGIIIDRNILNNLYKKSDILILTSGREGLPLVVMEAMSYGVIPICVSVGGMRDYIKDGLNGFLVEDGDVDKIVQKFVIIIKRLLSNSGIREKLSRNTYRYIKRRMNPKEFKENYLHLFGE